MWQIEQNSQAEAAEFSGFLGVGSLLLPQCFSLTEHPTVEILARFHNGQHLLDFGRVLMSFLYDLAFCPGSRVISPQQMLCVPAPSQVKSSGEFTPFAILDAN